MKKMKKMKQLLYIIILLVTVSSCAVKITINRDKDIDISNAKTFSYYGMTEVNDLVDINIKTIEKALANELKRRGLTYKEKNGDIVISLFLVVDKNSTTNRYGSYYGHGPYGFYQPTWGWGYGYASGYNTVPYAGVPYRENAYYRGTLIMDVFDLKTKKLAWQGVLSKAIDLDAHKKKDKSQQLAKRLMKTFPIKPVK